MGSAMTSGVTASRWCHDLDPHQEGAEVVVDDSSVTLCSSAWEAVGREQLVAGPGELGGWGGAQVDPVVGRHEPGGQRRLAEPDVEQVDQPVAVRQVPGESGPDLGQRQAVREDDVDDLRLARHPRRQGHRQHHSWPRRLRLAGRDREPRRRQGCHPCLDRLGTGVRRRIEVTPEDDPPALASLAGPPSGTVVHVC